MRSIVAFFRPIYVCIVVVIREIIFFFRRWTKKKEENLNKRSAMNKMRLNVVFNITETKSRVKELKRQEERQQQQRGKRSEMIYNFELR